MMNRLFTAAARRSSGRRRAAAAVVCRNIRRHHQAQQHHPTCSVVCSGASFRRCFSSVMPPMTATPLEETDGNVLVTFSSGSRPVSKKLLLSPQMRLVRTAAARIDSAGNAAGRNAILGGSSRLLSTRMTTSTGTGGTTSTNLDEQSPPAAAPASSEDDDAGAAVGDDDAIETLIKEYATQHQTPVSLQALMRTGQGEFLHRTFGEETRQLHAATDLVLMQVAGFLRRELPIRLAHRIHDLDHVPILRQMPSILGVRELYRTSFQDLISLPPHVQTPAEEEQFARTVENIYERHANAMVQMARGAFEFRAAMRDRNSEADYELKEGTHDFLDRFYICRIGIRVLIGQYLALRQPPVENYIGIICSQTSPYEIVKRAIDDAAFMCTRKYGDAPEVIMSGRLDMTFPYVPTHLHYILLELLKNSMRATVEFHGIDEDYPPIKVVIADGDENEDVIIKVSDEGGGISRSNMKKIWSYLFTTADPSIQEGMVGSGGNNVDHGIDAPLAGLGYGLPISRSYCRYFGGDLSVMSMEGYGTDAFVYLARLGNMREPLPI